MELSPRQLEIMTLARGSGRVAVEELSQRFSVTPQTIRKDLNELCEGRLLSRVHGGAMLASGVVNLEYAARQMLAEEEKRLIGQRAASLIPDDCSLFINIGTTTEAVARALSGHRGLLVITNNINVVTQLYQNARIEVIVAGGLVRQSDGGVVGEAAVDFIRQFKVDIAVIGASAIDEDGALLDYDYREVRVAQAIVANARETMLVADRSKLARSAPVRIGDMSQVSSFVTDRLESEKLRRVCQVSGVQIEEAGTGVAEES